MNIFELVQMLQPLEKVTRELCGGKIATASKVIPMIDCLKNKIAQLRENIDATIAFSLLNLLENSISMRFGRTENNYVMATWTILDPRFKELHFTDHMAYSEAIKRIGRWMNDFDPIVVSNSNDETLAPSQSDDLWSFHEVLLNRNSGKRLLLKN